MTLTPQIVGQAENAHLPVLARILARTGTTKNQWVALTLTAAAGGSFDRDQLAGRLHAALKIDDAAAATAIAELVDARLLVGAGTTVALTEQGAALHRQIRSAVDEVVARAYGGLPAEDLATAARVLAVITERLNAETAETAAAAR
ncbi:hypothetical protein F4553_000279 [Allocatelliglobosispora scoriae]|uniref:MarR family transcriptional regulator n=1 Tax=Allocatelliglobosispora scoriae TaxID=643052 RepID=A0A841BJA1_9ACTN|nr:hypothetical protein [Allocatelliglobosispora scoriae]MBB5866900.1 hypothetical protein [Allocatelliglobosispora scoriae]